MNEFIAVSTDVCGTVRYLL